jgi:hypothetical protein
MWPDWIYWQSEENLLCFIKFKLLLGLYSELNYFRSVPDSGKGVCADPVERAAILEVKGPGPLGGVSERQLSPDRGGEKT